VSLNMRPPRTTWFQPVPSASSSGVGLGGADLVAGRRMETPSLRPRSRSVRIAAIFFASFRLLQTL
jgi:hypothetical protein